jgi:hypothetical protein
VSFYEIGIPSIAAGAGAAAITHQGATSAAARLREYGVFVTTAVVTSVLLGRPANTPVGTGPTLANAVDPDSSPASVVNTHTTWSTAPTTPTVVFRRISLPAVTGAGIVWGWNPGEEIVLS